MKRVRIFRDWKPSVKCDFDYKDIKIVQDDSYDFAIIHNTPKPKLKVPKERVIGFAWEPWSFRNYSTYIEYAKNNIGSYFVPELRNLPNPPFCEMHSFMYRYDKWEQKLEDNRLPLCVISSNKSQIPGHKRRHQIIRELLKTDIDIHIYGRGIQNIFKDKRVKGTVKSVSDVYSKYYFSLPMENSREGSYISEKLFNPLFYKCCPIYWGSSKISDYCNDFYYNMPDKVEDVVKFIKEVYNNYKDFYDKKLGQIEESRNNIINYNYLDFCNYYFDNGTFQTIKL